MIIQHNWAYNVGVKCQRLGEEDDVISAGPQRMNRVNWWALGIH